MAPPQREVRAAHTDATVTVYQAYAPEIGVPAAEAGRFPAAWKRDRMTWVTKPRSQTPSVAERRRPGRGLAFPHTSSRRMPRSASQAEHSSGTARCAASRTSRRGAGAHGPTRSRSMSDCAGRVSLR
ncbi:DUF4291 family protein [Streptomyces griseoaurantiacus]|uniref:DUF4291 family protein n=1 Tax=Streptomyces griseoaurantiacus TaxID=68213 RepID=UPI0037952945